MFSLSQCRMLIFALIYLYLGYIIYSDLSHVFSLVTWLYGLRQGYDKEEMDVQLDTKLGHAVSGIYIFPLFVVL